jgi:hypothetical protein
MIRAMVKAAVREYFSPLVVLNRRLARRRVRVASMRETPTTLEAAEAQLSNDVYAASGLLEDLENAGLVMGNGHHLRQAVAAFAVAKLRERWKAQIAPPSKPAGWSAESASLDVEGGLD